MNRVEAEYVILGAGLAGLSAAAGLGESAVVVERDSRPGGLVRTFNFDGYWFDAVLHFLYFPDKATQDRVLTLMDEPMHSLSSEAFVEFADGVTAFPFQSNLAGLPADVRAECIKDFIEASRTTDITLPADYEALLLRTFGRAMCERFFFPYNEKMWQRPLHTLAVNGFHWNLALPALEEVLRGAIGAATTPAYNANGWYPRPDRHARIRGMEVVTRALARQAPAIHLNQRVETIDVESRIVRATGDDGPTEYHWSSGCVCTLPLPQVIRMCLQAPEALRSACDRLVWNRVRSVMLSIEGPRPKAAGHWRYYPSQDVCFTRLSYMCEFDPEMAPPHGWSLLAEVPEAAERARLPDNTLIANVVDGLSRTGALPAYSRIVGRRVMTVDPAYVVFTPHNAAVIESARQFLRSAGIEPLGRYGRWEYSSMAHVMRDGFSWCDSMVTAKC